MIKTFLKNVLWAPIKAKIQERTIESEYEEYRKIFDKKYPNVSIETIRDDNYIKSQLDKRLKKDGITPLQKTKGQLNILYLSPMDNWEKVNMPHALEKFGKVHYYNLGEYEKIIKKQAYPPDWSQQRKELNADIYNYVSQLKKDGKLDIVVSYLSGKHLLPETIEKINKLGIITTAFWLDSDIKFRSTHDGEVYAGAASVCKHYHLNLCSDTQSLIKYFAEDGLAVFWPEGANPDHFKPMEGKEKIYDISFIGAKYGKRINYINYLKRNGINVSTFGYGWGSGNISGKDMIRIYAQSKINLGFGGIGYSMKATHLKGRDFEVPMCGAVYLTTYDEDLEKVYEEGKHIFTFRSKKEMLQKVKFLLENEALCHQVRQDIRQYCVSNHSWEKRFDSVFKLFGVDK